MQSTKSLDDISHQIDFKNVDNNNLPKFKLLLVQNDRGMQVLQNQALPQGQEEWKKEVFDINNDFYLLHIVDKQIRFNKSFEKYIKEGIQFRLINQQNALHIISLVKELKEILGTLNSSNKNNQSSVDNKILTEENNQFTQQTQAQQQQRLQKPLIQINKKSYSKCYNTHCKNLSHNNKYYYQYSNTDNKNSQQNQEESKIQVEENNDSIINNNYYQEKLHLFQEDKQEKDDELQQQSLILQLINQATQEYLINHSNLNDLVYWKLDFAISQKKEVQKFNAKQVQDQLLQCQPRLEVLLESRRKEIMMSDDLMFKQPKRKYSNEQQQFQINNHQNSISPSPSPSIKSNNDDSLVSFQTSKLKTTPSISSSSLSNNKRVNPNKFAKDKVSKQLVTNKRAIMKNKEWILQQQQQQQVQQQNQSKNKGNNLGTKLRLPKNNSSNQKQQQQQQQQQKQQKQQKLKEQLKEQEQEQDHQHQQEQFDSQKLTRSQLKKLLQQLDDFDEQQIEQSQQQ